MEEDKAIGLPKKLKQCCSVLVVRISRVRTGFDPNSRTIRKHNTHTHTHTHTHTQISEPARTYWPLRARASRTTECRRERKGQLR